jgi:translation initiation factor IF-3
MKLSAMKMGQSSSVTAADKGWKEGVKWKKVSAKIKVKAASMFPLGREITNSNFGRAALAKVMDTLQINPDNLGDEGLKQVFGFSIAILEAANLMTEARYVNDFLNKRYKARGTPDLKERIMESFKTENMSLNRLATALGENFNTIEDAVFELISEGYLSEDGKVLKPYKTRY